jgi:uncharacterized membrane protein HdeD (DUF308 family)
MILAESTWSVNNLLDNLTNKRRGWGGALMIIIGVVMAIVGIFKIAQGMISHGKTQVNWVLNILLIVVGALFCVGGAFFTQLTSSNSDSIGHGIMNELNGMGQGAE